MLSGGFTTEERLLGGSGWVCLTVLFGQADAIAERQVAPLLRVPPVLFSTHAHADADPHLEFPLRP